MPYCRKCGAKLADDARFCQVCGTPVTSPVAGVPRTAPIRQPVRKAQFPTAAIILIAILILAVVVAAVVLLPFQPVEFNQQNEASAANVNSLYFNLEADIADINVHFRDLPANQRVQVNTSATGWRNILGTDQPVNLTLQESSANASLIYIVKVSRPEGRSMFSNVNVICDVLIDPSIRLDLNLRTSTGRIEIDADKTVTISKLFAETTTGDVNVTLSEGVIFSGPSSLRSITGSNWLLWNNADISRNTSVNVGSMTGNVYVNLTQTKQLSGNLTVSVENSNRGFIALRLTVRDDVGAKISATANMGEVRLQQKGFSGNELPIQSSNYPSQNNFILNLENAGGRTDINAIYELTGVRS